MHKSLSFATLVFVLPLVSAHGYIKQVSFDEAAPVTAQKTNIAQSSFRAAPDNTGWVGSNFLSSKCLVCGCSNTPFGEIAAPGGTVFSDAAQSAGQTTSVAAGKSVQLLVAGNPGEGWPHATGHLQVYLGKCTGATCSDFDASTAQFFKILSIPNGAAALKAAYDRTRDGNPWEIPIPAAVPSGAFMLRAEVIAYSQSSAAEGRQVQFYPFCGQINVVNGGNANQLATVQFPQVYATDNLIASQGISHVPGPLVDAVLGGNGTFSSGSLLSAANEVAGTPAPAAMMNGGTMNNGGMKNGGGMMNNGGGMMNGKKKQGMMNGGKKQGMMKKPPCDKKKTPNAPPPAKAIVVPPPAQPALMGSAHARHRARQQERRNHRFGRERDTIFV